MRERPAIDLLEEAASLLRSCSPAMIATYLAGAVPFWIGLLFFFADMAQNPFAAERLPFESLAVAGLLVWKGVWQAIFKAQLYRRLSLSDVRSLNIGRVVAVQCALQPLSLLAIPVALILTLPFAWSVAFFRNAGLFAALGDADPIGAARRQAGLWPRQNWYALGLVSLAALLLFANVLIVIVLLPQVGRSFLGIENDFARLGMRLLNVMTVAVAVSTTWLVIDPLLDAVYVLRCFQGASLRSGEDLRVSFRKLIGALALLLMLLTGAPAARSQISPVPPAHAPTTGIDPARLSRSMEEVIRRREFAWRSPKPAGPEPTGRWVGWVRSAQRILARASDWLGRKLREWFKTKPDTESGREPSSERPSIELWIAIAAVVLAGGLVAALFRGRRSPRSITEAAAAATIPDLSDESVTADQLPESSWLQIAEEWLAKGDRRMALRALYLAALNYLSTRRLVSIHRSKTGRDYRRELERNARSNPAIDANMTPVFARNVALFERGWYGRHPVEPAEVESFLAGLEEMRRYAARQ